MFKITQFANWKVKNGILKELSDGDIKGVRIKMITTKREKLFRSFRNLLGISKVHRILV